MHTCHEASHCTTPRSLGSAPKHAPAATTGPGCQPQGAACLPLTGSRIPSSFTFPQKAFFSSFCVQVLGFSVSCTRTPSSRGQHSEHDKMTGQERHGVTKIPNIWAGEGVKGIPNFNAAIDINPLMWPIIVQKGVKINILFASHKHIWFGVPE